MIISSVSVRTWRWSMSSIIAMVYWVTTMNRKGGIGTMPKTSGNRSGRPRLQNLGVIVGTLHAMEIWVQIHSHLQPVDLWHTRQFKTGHPSHTRMDPQERIVQFTMTKIEAPLTWSITIPQSLEHRGRDLRTFPWRLTFPEKTPSGMPHCVDFGILGCGKWEGRNDIVVEFLSMVWIFGHLEGNSVSSHEAWALIIWARSYVLTNAKISLLMYLTYGNIVYIQANFILDGSSKVVCALFRSLTWFPSMDSYLRRLRYVHSLFHWVHEYILKLLSTFKYWNISPGILVHLRDRSRSYLSSGLLFSLFMMTTCVKDLIWEPWRTQWSII